MPFGIEQLTFYFYGDYAINKIILIVTINNDINKNIPN